MKVFLQRFFTPYDCEKMNNSSFDHSGAEKGEWPVFSMLPITQGCTSNTVHHFSQPGMSFPETPCPAAGCWCLFLNLCKRADRTPSSHALVWFPEGTRCRDRGSLLPGADNSLLCIRVAALAALWGLDELAGAVHPLGAEMQELGKQGSGTPGIRNSPGQLWDSWWPEVAPGTARMHSAGIHWAESERGVGRGEDTCEQPALCHHCPLLIPVVWKSEKREFGDRKFLLESRVMMLVKGDESREHLSERKRNQSPIYAVFPRPLLCFPRHREWECSAGGESETGFGDHLCWRL